MTDPIDKLTGGGKKSEISYDEAKELARHDDPEVRRQLASRSDIKPEILYYLAEDPSPEVRLALALNEAAPRHADLLLATDEDQDVRGGLAAKISNLAPQLDPEEKDRVERMAYEALEILTRDQVTRVRQIVADTLKDVAQAPPDLIRRLAWDVEIVVSGPILEYSPVLTDEDLLEIIEHGTATGRLSCISKRENVGETIVDAVVATSDEEAIGLLLANHSAQIREETLDLIIDRAEQVESWHAPLVARPALSERAAMNLAQFVAENLIENLVTRQDFSPEIVSEIRATVAERLEKTDHPSTGERADAAEPSSTPLEAALEEAKRLKSTGELREPFLAAALEEGQRELVVAALALLSGAQPIAVEKCFRKKSTKGILAVVWKAGFEARFAERLQRSLAGIEDEDILKAEKSGEYPISEGDLEWQFELVEGDA